MADLGGVDVEGVAERFGDEAFAGDLEHLIELGLREIDALVLDGEDAGAGVQELHEVFLGFDGVIRPVGAGGFLRARVAGVIDGEFVEHRMDEV